MRLTIFVGRGLDEDDDNDIDDEVSNMCLIFVQNWVPV